MGEYQLPDGTTAVIPDDLPRGERAAAEAELKRLWLVAKGRQAALASENTVGGEIARGALGAADTAAFGVADELGAAALSAPALFSAERDFADDYTRRLAELREMQSGPTYHGGQVVGLLAPGGLARGLARGGARVAERAPGFLGALIDRAVPLGQARRVPISERARDEVAAALGAPAGREKLRALRSAQDRAGTEDLLGQGLVGPWSLGAAPAPIAARGTARDEHAGLDVAPPIAAGAMPPPSVVREASPPAGALVAPRGVDLPMPPPLGDAGFDLALPRPRDETALDLALPSILSGPPPTQRPRGLPGSVRRLWGHVRRRRPIGKPAGRPLVRERCRRLLCVGHPAPAVRASGALAPATRPPLGQYPGSAPSFEAQSALPPLGPYPGPAAIEAQALPWILSGPPPSFEAQPAPPPANMPAQEAQSALWRWLNAIAATRTQPLDEEQRHHA